MVKNAMSSDVERGRQDLKPVQDLRICLRHSGMEAQVPSAVARNAETFRFVRTFGKDRDEGDRDEKMLFVLPFSRWHSVD